MIPQSLNTFLSLGTIGHNHLLTAAQKAFQAAQSAGASAEAARLIELGGRLFCMAWTEFPLNAPLARELVQLSQTLPVIKSMLNPNALLVLTRIAEQGVGEASLQIMEFFSSRDYEAMVAHLEAGATGHTLLPTVRQAMLCQGLLSNWNWQESFVRRTLHEHDPEIASFLLADIFLAAGKFEQAVEAYGALVETYGIPGLRFKLASAQAGLGDVDSSLKNLSYVLSEFPLHTSALLLMDSLAFPASRGAPLPGKCVVCIYSYNKSDELAKTLESVLASDLSRNVGDISLKVLINGSEDDSLAVVEAARVGFDGDLEVVSLPVNVGAPAARNWLIDSAVKDGAEWIAFLDDDVLVPADWLSGLASGVQEFPDAGVWGCRVSDALSPSVTQHGDGFLLGSEDAQAQGRRVVLHEPAAESLVPVQLGYRRRAASVTGCCHLFRADTLVRNKGFDLSFSPSQFDDLDSDLRLLLDGKPAVYLGDIEIRHLRVSSLIQELSPHALQQSENHRSLLEGRHAGHLDRLLGIQERFVEQDLDKKRGRLRGAGWLKS